MAVTFVTKLQAPRTDRDRAEIFFLLGGSPAFRFPVFVAYFPGQQENKIKGLGKL